MKKIVFALLAIAISLHLNSPTASGWGQLGHATIGQVAQDHLTPKACRYLSWRVDNGPWVHSDKS